MRGACEFYTATPPHTPPLRRKMTCAAPASFAHPPTPAPTAEDLRGACAFCTSLPPPCPPYQVSCGAALFCTMSKSKAALEQCELVQVVRGAVRHAGRPAAHGPRDAPVPGSLVRRGRRRPRPQPRGDQEPALPRPPPARRAPRLAAVIRLRLAFASGAEGPSPLVVDHAWCPPTPPSRQPIGADRAAAAPCDPTDRCSRKCPFRFADSRGPRRLSHSPRAPINTTTARLSGDFCAVGRT